MSVQDTIRAKGAALADAINAGDAARAADHYTAYAALMPPGAPLQQGRDAIRTFWQGAIDAGLSNVVLAPDDIEAMESDAVETGVLTGTMGEARIVGKYVVHWRRDGAHWRLHRDIWNTDT